MTIRIATTKLLTLLAELTPTATAGRGAGFAGVLLHTAHGEYGTEPGATTLLVGTSASGRVVGHTYQPCDGTLEPTLITLQDVVSLRALLAPRTKTNADHSVEIRRDLATVTITEPADLFDEGDSITLHVGDLDAVPRTLWTTLKATPDMLHQPTNVKGQPLPTTPRVDLAAAALAPFVAVAKLRTDTIQAYIGHPHHPVLIQIGGTYRGALYPARWAEDMAPGTATREGAAPDADVHWPDLPPVAKKHPGLVQVITFPTIVDVELPLEDPATDPLEQATAAAKAALDSVKPGQPAFTTDPT